MGQAIYQQIFIQFQSSFFVQPFFYFYGSLSSVYGFFPLIFSTSRGQIPICFFAEANNNIYRFTFAKIKQFLIIDLFVIFNIRSTIPLFIG